MALILITCFLSGCALNDRTEQILEGGLVQSIENAAGSGFTPYSLIPVAVAGVSLGAYKLRKFISNKRTAPMQSSTDVEQQVKMADGSRLL